MTVEPNAQGRIEEMTTADHLRSNVIAGVETIDMLEALAQGEELSEAQLEDYGLDEDADLWDALNTVAFEVEPWRRGKHIVKVEILLGTGGPDIRAYIQENGWVTVKGNWSGVATVERSTTAPTLAAALFDYFEEVGKT